MKHISTLILSASIALMACLWAPLWGEMHLYDLPGLNVAAAIMGSLAMASCLYLLGATAARYTRLRPLLLGTAVVIALGSSWVVGAYLASSYTGPMSALLGSWWWPTAVLLASLSELAVIGAGAVRSVHEAEERSAQAESDQIERVSLDLSRAQKQIAELETALQEAHLRAASRGSRRTYAARLLEAADREWARREDLIAEAGIEPSRATAPLRRLIERGALAKMTDSSGQELLRLPTGSPSAVPRLVKVAGAE